MPPQSSCVRLAIISVMHPTDDNEEALRQYEIAKKLLKKFEDQQEAEEVYFVAHYGRARRHQARVRKFGRPRHWRRGRARGWD